MLRETPVTEIPWTTQGARRIGDMHPRKSLSVHQNFDGDIVVSIGVGPIPIGGVTGEQNAVVEFCSMINGGGRSTNTRLALVALMEAIKKDNEERPDADPDQVST
ncbi:MAG: hypothetical protein JWN64_525 [Parcubacteria group bacterium]|nr:hypothetical protein [Parcubacteria group bacterium]